MAGNWKMSCVAGGVVFVGATGVLVTFLRAATPPNAAQVPVGVAAALLLGASVANLFTTAGAIADRRLLRNAINGVPPVEGQRNAFAGTIQSTERVVAPLSGQEVVAYDYSISQWSKGRDSTLYTYYEGWAYVPSTIVTTAGTFPLRNRTGAGTAPIGDRDAAVQRFQEYLSRTTFTLAPTAGGPFEDPTSVARRDRADIKRWKGEPDWQRAVLTESTLRSGDHVTIHGFYSRSDGIVPGPDILGRAFAMRGSADDALRRATSEVNRAVSGVVVLAAAAILLVWGYGRFIASAW